MACLIIFLWIWVCGWTRWISHHHSQFRIFFGMKLAWHFSRMIQIFSDFHNGIFHFLVCNLKFSSKSLYKTYQKFNTRLFLKGAYLRQKNKKIIKKIQYSDNTWKSPWFEIIVCTIKIKPNRAPLVNKHY